MAFPEMLDVVSTLPPPQVKVTVPIYQKDGIYLMKVCFLVFIRPIIQNMGNEASAESRANQETNWAEPRLAQIRFLESTAWVQIQQETNGHTSRF
jgi:hypothetical protein